MVLYSASGHPLKVLAAAAVVVTSDHIAPVDCKHVWITGGELVETLVDIAAHDAVEFAVLSGDGHAYCFGIDVSGYQVAAAHPALVASLRRAPKKAVPPRPMEATACSCGRGNGRG
jgi:hypothetical protein